MHINTIKINGFAAIKEWELDTEGGHVVVSGGNRQGKSSFLRAIFAVLTGKDLPGVPVNEDCIKARVTLGLSDGHTVSWSQGKSGNATLKVEREDGQPVTGGDRTYLNRLIGEIGGDPMELVYMAPKDQKAKIQKILGLDFSDLDKAHADNLAAAKTARDLAASFRQQLSRLGDVVRTEPVDVAALLEAQRLRQEAGERGKELARVAADASSAVTATVDAIDGLKLQIENLQGQLKNQESLLATRQAALNTANAVLDEAREAFKAMPDHTQAIAEASETNRKAEQWKTATQIQADLEASELKAEQAKEEGEKIAAERVRRLTETKFPVKGLEFTEDGILYNGLPFNDRSQCTSDIIKVGLALQMVSDPGLKVVKINRASELDKESLAKVMEILTKFGFQGFFEQVTSGPLETVVIESIPNQGEEA